MSIDQLGLSAVWLIIGFFLGVIHMRGKVGRNSQQVNTFFTLAYKCGMKPTLYQGVSEFQTHGSRVAVLVPKTTSNGSVTMTRKGNLAQKHIILRISGFDFSDRKRPTIILGSPGRDLFDVLKYGDWHMEVPKEV